LHHLLPDGSDIKDHLKALAFQVIFYLSDLDFKLRDLF